MFSLAEPEIAARCRVRRLYAEGTSGASYGRAVSAAVKVFFDAQRAGNTKIDPMGRSGTAAVVVGLTLFSVTLSANRASDSLRARGSIEIYSMDRDQALTTFRQAIAADPQDAAAYRGVATALWLTITYRRGSMTVDDYIGRVRRGNPAPPPPPPAETANEFRIAVEKALDLARKQVA